MDGPPHRDFTIFRRRVGGGAFVEAHGDIGSEVFLDLHRFLRGQFEQIAVEVGAEDGSAIVDFEIGGEAVDLIAAAVGEDGAMPVHESVEAAELRDKFVAGRRVRW